MKKSILAPVAMGLVNPKFSNVTSIFLKQPNMEIVLSVDDNLKNPALLGKFKLTDATIELLMDQSPNSKIKFIPNIKDITGYASYFPLKNTFITYCKYDLKNMPFKITYKHEMSKIYWALYPQFNWKGYLIRGSVKAENINDFRFGLNVINKAFENKYKFNRKTQIFSAIFSTIYQQKAGYIKFNYDFENKELETFILGKMQIKDISHSIITTFNKLYSVRYNARIPYKFEKFDTVNGIVVSYQNDLKYPILEIGTHVTYQNYQFDVATNNQYNFVATAETNLNENISIKLGVAFEKEMTYDIKEWPKYQFSLIVNQ